MIVIDVCEVGEGEDFGGMDLVSLDWDRLKEADGFFGKGGGGFWRDEGREG